MRRDDRIAFAVVVKRNKSQGGELERDQALPIKGEWVRRIARRAVSTLSNFIIVGLIGDSVGGDRLRVFLIRAAVVSRNKSL